VSGSTTQFDESRDALMDALLSAALGDHAEARNRLIDKVLAQMRSGESAQRPQPTRPSDRRRWMILGLAASILMALVFGLPWLVGPPIALAAIERSLMAAAAEISRHYTIRTTFVEDDGTKRIVVSDLYVKGNDRFALRHPALLSDRDAWLGHENGQAWVVPGWGPVRTGDRIAFSRWLNAQEKFATPYLHVSTVLQRMSSGFVLAELSRETVKLANGTEIACRHIRGTSKDLGAAQPHSIELWADSSTDVAVRIVARWDVEPNAMGREQVELEFADASELAENWFRAEGHYHEPRLVIRFDSTDESTDSSQDVVR
jgi:hypothetical protein